MIASKSRAGVALCGFSRVRGTGHFVDRYEEALRALIEEKKKGKPVRAARPANDDGKVVDLMDALKKSLKGSGGSRERVERFTEAKTKNGKKPGARRRAA